MVQRYPLSAHYVKTSFNLSKLEQRNDDMRLWRKERNLLVFKMSETQFVCVYSFGVVAFFGIGDRKEIARIIRGFGKAGEEEPGVSMDELPADDYAIVTDPDSPEGVEFDSVRLRGVVVEKLLLVLHALAQSVAIDFLENRVEDILHRYEKIHGNLARRGVLDARTRDIMKTIGASGTIVSFIVGQLSLLDKPDIAWEDRDAETLFINLRKMFELEDRFSALKFKLTFVQDTSELMLDALHSRRAEYLELTIIILIVFEIAMALLGVMK